MKLFASIVLLSSSFARAEDSPFSFFSDEKETVYKNSFDDTMCKQLAHEKPSKCITQPEQVSSLVVYNSFLYCTGGPLQSNEMESFTPQA